MAWAFPRRSFATDYLLDCDAINDNLLAYSPEVNQTNEHNWNYDTISGASSVLVIAETDFMLRAYTTQVALDPFLTVGSLVELPQSIRWARLPGLTKTWVSRGGQVYLSASFQCRMEAATSKQGGVHFAIEVDGTVLMDGLLGSGDLQNDFVDGNANGLGSGSTASGTAEYDYGSAPAIRGDQHPVCVEVLARVGPGEHTAYVVYRNVLSTTAVAQYRSNGELIVLDMWS